jgi:hypothetical protein
MLVSIDIVFHGPQIRILNIMIVQAPLYEKGVHGMDAWLYSSPQST